MIHGINLNMTPETIAKAQTGPISAAAIEKVVKLTENPGNLLMTDTPPDADCYIPLRMAGYDNSGVAKSGNSTTDYVEQFLLRFSLLAVNLLPYIETQSSMIKNFMDMQIQFTNALNTMMSGIQSLTSAEFDFIKNQSAKARGEEITGTQKSGIWATLIGLGEMVLGLVVCACSGGIGSIVGGVMLLDGLSKTISGVITIADPAYALKHPKLAETMQSGLFAVFSGLGSSAPAIIQSVVSIIMGLLSCGTSLIAAGAGILANIYTLANTAVTSYGLIDGFIKGLKPDKNATDGDDGVSFAQVASMGILACIVYVAIQYTGAAAWIKQNWGENALLGIEMGLFIVAGLAGMGVAKGLSKLPEVPETITGSSIWKGGQGLYKQFTQILSSSSGLQKLQNYFDEFKIINNLNKVSANFNLAGVVSQLGGALLVYRERVTQRVMTKIEALSNLYQQTDSIILSLLSSQIQSGQDTQGRLTDISNDMAQSLQDFVSGLNGIVTKGESWSVMVKS